MNNAMDFLKDMSYDEFAQDVKTMHATVRTLEIIGEAVKNIPDDVRKIGSSGKSVGRCR